MLDLRQVLTRTDFKRNRKEMVARLAETHKAVVLTVKVTPALVIRDADRCQALMDCLDKAEGREG